MLGGAEVPRPPVTGPAVKDEYKEGFEGYPHNFNSVVPDRILKQHPDWLGLARGEQFGKANVGKRVPGPAPCFANDELIQFVADKMLAWAALTPGVPQRFNLLPMDAAVYCECPQCLALNQPFVAPDIPYCAYPTYYASDAYYHFVCEVAKRVATRAPNVTVGALAYANVLAPPRKIETFPANVVVQVCQYWATNLPVTAPANAQMKAYLEDWHRKCGRLENYEYVLLNENRQTWRLPVPMVSGIVDRAKLLKQSGALGGGTQATPETLPYSPWNFYAYARSCWNPDSGADQILKEFFDACYGEAGAPMLGYYRAAEDWHAQHEFNLHAGGYGYGLAPGAFPYPVLQAMAGQLAAADKVANCWITRKRLATARQGFAALLQARGLTPEELAASDRLPVAGLGRPPVVVTPKTAQILPGPRGGDCMLYGWLRLGHNVRFERAGDYTVTVSATGYEREKRGNQKRELVIYVDAARFGPVDVPDGAKDYAVTVKVPAGVSEVSIQVPQNVGPVAVREFSIKANP